jgi:hypothetical protein
MPKNFSDDVKSFIEQIVKTQKPIKIGKIEISARNVGQLDEFQETRKADLHRKSIYDAIERGASSGIRRSSAGSKSSSSNYSSSYAEPNKILETVSGVAGKTTQTLGQSLIASSLPGQIAGLGLDVAKEFGIGGAGHGGHGRKVSKSKWDSSYLKYKDDMDESRWKQTKGHNTQILDSVNKILKAKNKEIRNLHGDSGRKGTHDELDKYEVQKRGFFQQIAKNFKDKEKEKEERKKLLDRYKNIAKIREENVKALKSEISGLKASRSKSLFRSNEVDKLIAQKKHRILTEKESKKNAEKAAKQQGFFHRLGAKIFKRKSKKEAGTSQGLSQGSTGGKLLAGLLGGGLLLGDALGAKSGSGVGGFVKSAIFGQVPEAYDYGRDAKGKLTKTARKGATGEFLAHGAMQTAKYAAIGSLIGGDMGAMIGVLVGVIETALEWLWKTFFEPWWLEDLKPMFETFTKGWDNVKNSGLGRLAGLSDTAGRKDVIGISNDVFGKSASNLNLSDKKSSVRMYEEYATLLDEAKAKKEISQGDEQKALKESIQYLEANKKGNEENVKYLEKMLNALQDLNKNNQSITQNTMVDSDGAFRLKNSLIK